MHSHTTIKERLAAYATLKKIHTDHITQEENRLKKTIIKNETGDIYTKILVTRKQAVEGCNIPFSYQTTEQCEFCDGYGIKEDSKMSECNACKGKKYVLHPNLCCSNCYGTGTEILYPCWDCSGKGVIKVRKNISIEIPTRILNGTTLTFKGKGYAGYRKGDSGNLYLTVYINTYH